MTVSWNNKFYLKIYNYEINSLLNHITILKKSNRHSDFAGTALSAGAVLFFAGKTDFSRIIMLFSIETARQYRLF